MKKTCCLCGDEFEGWGNNPAPLADEGSCCDRCNLEKVIPARCEAARRGARPSSAKSPEDGRYN